MGRPYLTSSLLAVADARAWKSIGTYSQNCLRLEFLAAPPEGVIHSRRMVRDQQERDAAAERKRQSRACHASVTPLSQGEVRGQSHKSESESESEKVKVLKKANDL